MQDSIRALLGGTNDLKQEEVNDHILNILSQCQGIQELLDNSIIVRTPVSEEAKAGQPALFTNQQSLKIKLLVTQFFRELDKFPIPQFDNKASFSSLIEALSGAHHQLGLGEAVGRMARSIEEKVWRAQRHIIESASRRFKEGKLRSFLEQLKDNPVIPKIAFWKRVLRAGISYDQPIQVNNGSGT